MEEPQSMPSGHCPFCGALLKPGQVNCWICHATAPVEAANRPAQPAERSRHGLSLLLLFLTLLTILVGITIMSP